MKLIINLWFYIVLIEFFDFIQIKFDFTSFKNFNLILYFKYMLTAHKIIYLQPCLSYVIIIILQNIHWW